MALTGADAISDLIQIIYSSQPFGYDDAMLNGILLDARRCNTRDGVTGALVCRHDIYLQLLEGPRTEVQAAFERIRQDDRHLDVQLRVSETVHDRMFGDWAMLHDPARSWIWSPAEIADDILGRTTVADFRRVFEILIAKTDTEPPH
ncbi:MAG: BLUF domain-containing protein [Silicimonas sp.]